MSRLRMLQVWMATVVLSTGLVVVPGVAAGSTQTFTGKVSDAMCGAKHMEGGLAPAPCVRACVQKGAKYALVVGDKVYTLDTSDQAALANLSKLAWEEAKVTGTANGDTISVKSVTAAKQEPGNGCNKGVSEQTRCHALKVRRPEEQQHRAGAGGSSGRARIAMRDLGINPHVALSD